MARVFITGSADGLGQAAARTLLGDGHEVVVHVRADERLAAVRDLTDRGASAVVGDLLATSDDPGARTSGGYWYHQRRAAPHPAVTDHAFQDQLLATLARHTGEQLPSATGMSTVHEG